MEPNVYVPHAVPVVAAAMCRHGYARGHTIHYVPARLAYQEPLDDWKDVNRIAIDVRTGWCEADGVKFFNHTPRQILATLHREGPFLVRINTKYMLLTVSSAQYSGTWAFSIGLEGDMQIEELCDCDDDE